MKRMKPTRRLFLKGAGGAVLAMPFLESLAPRDAAGQTVTPPKRFIVLKSFSTQLVQEWYPRFTGKVTLSVSGLPAGTTANYSVNPVAAGSSSTFGVRTKNTTPRGTFSLTLFGTNGSIRHSTGLTLTVQ